MTTSKNEAPGRHVLISCVIGGLIGATIGIPLGQWIAGLLP